MRGRPFFFAASAVAWHSMCSPDSRRGDIPPSPLPMNLRPLLLLFLLSAALTALLCHALVNSDHRHSQWADVVTDLGECGRGKYLRRCHYAHFAEIARRESRPAAERLFRAMALSARVQERSCATAIRHLGGRYTPPCEVMLFDADTDTNLDKSIALEQGSLTPSAHHRITHALERENRYAARLLVWAASSDTEHLRLLKACRHPRTTDTLALHYLICPECGHVFESRPTRFCCPYCLTSERRFTRI